MLIRSVTRFTEKLQKSMSPERLSLGIVRVTRARIEKFRRNFHGNFTVTFTEILQTNNYWKMLRTQA